MENLPRRRNLKQFFLFLFFLVSLNTQANTITSLGNINNDSISDDDYAVRTIFTLPIQIKEDGTTEFGWNVNTETQTTTSDVIIDQPQPEEQVNWYFSPMIYAGAQNFKYLINLEDHSLNKAITLESGNPKSGYMVLEKSEWDMGIGGGIFTDVGATIGGGLIPTFGMMTYSERYASNLDEANHMKKIKFPKDSQALNDWMKGDSMVYTKKAGITFYASASYYGASAGVGFSALGNWRVCLKKISNEKIMATVSKINLESFGFFAGATLVTLNISAFEARDKSFAYQFNLASKSGQISFNEFLSGNFKFTEKFLKNETVEGVTPLTASEAQSQGRLLGVHLGVPILGTLDFNKGIVQSFSKTHQLKNNAILENTMAVYSRSVETDGVLSKNLKKVALFSVSHLEKNHLLCERPQAFNTANFKFFFSQKKTDSKTFEEGISFIKRTTGLWDTLEFKLPEDKLGYVKIEFDGMISSKGSKKLLALNLSPNSTEEISEKIEDYFQNESQPTKLCDFYRQVGTCKAHIQRASKSAFKKMGIKLEEMRKWYAEKNWKKYTESFAEMGKEALTNQFTFHTFLKMIGKENFHLQFKLSGEKLKTLSINNFKEDLTE